MCKKKKNHQTSEHSAPLFTVCCLFLPCTVAALCVIMWFVFYYWQFQQLEKRLKSQWCKPAVCQGLRVLLGGSWSCGLWICPLLGHPQPWSFAVCWACVLLHGPHEGHTTLILRCSLAAGRAGKLLCSTCGAQLCCKRQWSLLVVLWHRWSVCNAEFTYPKNLGELTWALQTRKSRFAGVELFWRWNIPLHFKMMTLWFALSFRKMENFLFPHYLWNFFIQSGKQWLQQSLSVV